MFYAIRIVMYMFQDDNEHRCNWICMTGNDLQYVVIGPSVCDVWTLSMWCMDLQYVVYGPSVCSVWTLSMRCMDLHSACNVWTFSM